MFCKCSLTNNQQNAFSIFNRHLIALNVEQMIVMAGIPDMNAATVVREKKAGSAAMLPVHLHLFTSRRGASLGGRINLLA